ncbi:membrane protein insertion efficiency factor YidD [Massilia forsythiae]|uniref:Putative membrane protein insertion efficiency factor n=1 Tax=Massilia forsythiae TaxID=2728020 RepID=A0A7Z2VVX7_9BURK|nr:membrane protein insertion efficiency factor YidD [Massilia forsythiae]QJE00231.1 membrane protein insertion efficiency factor YidD [Massilia forsythiae]
MNRLLVWLLRGYQLLVSPMLGQNCRFYPTCSNYAIEAVEVHGAARGGWLAVRRVCRCHPWNAGGVDPVPRHGAPMEQGVPADDGTAAPAAGHAHSSPTACACKHS